MKKIALTLAAFACVAASALAKTPQEEVVVHASPTLNLDEWVEVASKNVTNSLERVNLRWHRAGIGVTYVQFTCDENGKPTNIRTVKRSGSPGLDIVGRVAVRSMKPLHPLFKGAKPSQIFEAAIIVEDNEMDLPDRYEEVRQRAKWQNAYFAERGMPNPVMSLAAVRSL